MKDKKIIIGVTGGLATGKTTVSDMISSKGALKIDADQIAHELLEEDNPIVERVIELFSEDILTEGRIDRRKLAEKVFSDRENLQKLSSVMHPGIIRRIKDKANDAQESVIVIDAPLLIEAKMHGYADIVVVVKCSDENQIKRAKGRGISREEVKDIIDKQMSLSKKEKFADYIIDNDGEIEKIKEGVEEIWKNVQKKKKI